MHTEEKGIASSWGHEFPLSLPILDSLISEACEVVVFGSRAAGVHSTYSDLDVIVVSPQKRRISASGLDCILLTPQEVENQFWLGSELASHVVQFGKWVKGSGEWRANVRISHRAIARKRQRISAVVRNAAQRWCHLHPVFRVKYAITTRRELQRLDFLVKGLPIPPTPMLDSRWQAGQVLPADLIEVFDFGQLPSLELIRQLKALCR